MTLGTLLSISYIIGEMNSPIAQLVSFIKKITRSRCWVFSFFFTRLSEISTQLPEENNFNKQLNTKNNEGIVINNLSFSYENIQSSIVLNNINITIPNSKVTAIVGHSGSGKLHLWKFFYAFMNQQKAIFISTVMIY